jgi:hypothetical protein
MLLRSQLADATKPTPLPRWLSVTGELAWLFFMPFFFLVDHPYEVQMHMPSVQGLVVALYRDSSVHS